MAFVLKIKLEMIIPAARAEEIVDLIVKTAQTGKFGDGKISITVIGDAVGFVTGSAGIWRDRKKLRLLSQPS